ncbi:hypothetical protein IID22_03515 [Patescibacteria group bacterium]|nr:hypothetical protein [Patescibacteria group bacterium]
MIHKTNIPKLSDVLLLVTGIGVGVTASGYYSLYGYSILVSLLWLSSLVITGVYFWLRGKKNPRLLNAGSLYNSDLYIIIALLFVFVPLYLLFIYVVPFQINTDEIATMIFAKRITTQAYPDIFTLSEYFQFPVFIFIIFGWLGKLMGGINLVNMRLVHAVFGLATIVFSYFLFRPFLSPKLATSVAVLVGSNHALLAISRMAIRNNTILLIETASLFLLFIGFKRRQLFFSFLGGAVAGLSFYGYGPGRMTFILWLLFLLLVALFFRQTIKLKKLARLAVVSLLGFVLVVAPIGVATAKQINGGEALIYQRGQLLIFPEGRRLQQQWVLASSISEGVKTNIIQGLTVFNNRAHDQGYMYFNRGHGFVDPLTGVLIWVGLLAIFSKIVIKSERREADFLVLGSFLLLWLIFSFVVNKAPNYGRLLIILPFGAYFAVWGIKIISDFLGKQLGKTGLASVSAITKAVFGLTIVIIAFWNLAIYGDFIRQGVTEGNDVGGTARYIETRKTIPDYSYYLAADKEYPYFYTNPGSPWEWKDWISFFVGETQLAKVVSPESFLEAIDSPPFTIFMSQSLWQVSEAALIDLYPNLTIHSITPNSSLVALEVYQ